MIETMIQFRLDKMGPGETVLLRVSCILCLFSDLKHVRTIDGKTLVVCDEDWEKVEKAFRSAYLDTEVKRGILGYSIKTEEKT